MGGLNLAHRGDPDPALTTEDHCHDLQVVDTGEQKI